MGPNVRSISRSRDAYSFSVSEKAGAWKATATQGSVSVGQGTCAYTGPRGSGSCGMSTLYVPGFQSPQCFSTSGRTSSGVTSPATITAVYSGRYQRRKNSCAYWNWLGMSSMSRMKPMVVCL